MVEFKVKDKVKRISGEYEGMKKGDIGTVIKVNTSGDVKIKEYDDIDNDGVWHSRHSLEICRKNKKPTHIIVYDLEDKDPIKIAYSLPEAKEIAKKLLKQEDVIEESVVIYEIKKIIKPKISVRFS